MPGGGGIRLKYSNPMLLDDVAVDFPELPIILAHPSFPWQDEALAVACTSRNVYIDLSGWSPKYFPPKLVQYANTLLKHKVLFGSDFPLITPDRWLADFEALADPRRGAAADPQGERRPAARAYERPELAAARAAPLFAGDVAVVEGGRSVTYGELAARVRALGGLEARRVGYLGANSLAHIECWLGVPAFGRVLVDLNFRLSVEELAFMVRDAELDVLIADAERREIASSSACRDRGLRGAGRWARQRVPGRGRGRAGRDLLHRRHDRHAQGRDAQPPQPAGQRAAQPRRHRPRARRTAGCTSARCSTSRARRTSSPARGSARAPGDPPALRAGAPCWRRSARAASRTPCSCRRCSRCCSSTPTAPT